MNRRTFLASITALSFPFTPLSMCWTRTEAKIISHSISGTEEGPAYWSLRIMYDDGVEEEWRSQHIFLMLEASKGSKGKNIHEMLQEKLAWMDLRNQERDGILSPNPIFDIQPPRMNFMGADWHLYSVTVGKDVGYNYEV